MTPRFFTCSAAGCKRPSDRARGGCDTCHRYLCFKHRSPAFHRCTPDEELDEKTWRAQIDAEIDRLRSRIDDAAVCRYASELNGGKACSIEHDNDTMGACNYHAHIRFHDGSATWLLRVPRVTSFGGRPESLMEYLVVSEYATLKFLEKTAVPAPRAFGYGICSDGSDRGVGVCFLLVEKLPGKAWVGGGLPVDEANKAEKTKVMGGIADMLEELAKHPFPKAGSLCLDEASRIQVGPTASDRFTALDPEGPFETALEYYRAWAEQYLALIADRQLYNEYPVEAYLVYRFLKDNAEQLVRDGGRGTTEVFFLKHVDDHGGHLLVDDDFNITGIIDWQMARVAPAVEAFGPSLVSADMSAFWRGRMGLNAGDAALADALREKRCQDLAGWMEDKNEKGRRFFWGLGLEGSWSRALPQAKGVLEAFGVQQGWEEWRETALREYSADKRLRALVRACPPRRPHLPRRCKQVARNRGIVKK